MCGGYSPDVRVGDAFGDWQASRPMWTEDERRFRVVEPRIDMRANGAVRDPPRRECQPTSTVAPLPVRVPGTTQQVDVADVYARGWPPAVTVVLPDWIVPIWVGGAKFGSLGCSPACGGDAKPVAPATATGFPATCTVATTPWTMGDENGRLVGTGAPAAPGIWCGQVPVIESPATTAG